MAVGPPAGFETGIISEGPALRPNPLDTMISGFDKEGEGGRGVPQIQKNDGIICNSLFLQCLG